jgi:hypothetical protein
MEIFQLKLRLRAIDELLHRHRRVRLSETGCEVHVAPLCRDLSPNVLELVTPVMESVLKRNEGSQILESDILATVARLLASGCY